MIISQVSLLVNSSRGCLPVPTVKILYEYAQREYEFYDNPVEDATGTIDISIDANWGKRWSRICSPGRSVTAVNSGGNPVCFSGGKIMPEVSIVAAMPEHAAELVSHVRQADIEEFESGWSMTPEQVLDYG